MKQSEAILIPQLLAERVPRPVVEEAYIEGTRMLVIIGNEVDTVIRYSRSGSVDMPQLSSYPENADAAAHADERLARQRASGRRNTTGEGVDWPRNWKLAAAKAVGKIWYEGSKPVRNAGIGNAVSTRPSVSSTLPKLDAARDKITVELLRRTHQDYRRTVPNSYDVSIREVDSAFSRQNVSELARALAEWVKDLNRQYYRFRPDEANTVAERLEPILKQELTNIGKFRVRKIASVEHSEEAEIMRPFRRLRVELGPVGAGKALHVLAPNFFPLWDNAIAESYGLDTERGYFKFMLKIKQQILNLPDEIVPGVSTLKLLDEYNYLRASEKRRGAY